MTTVDTLVDFARRVEEHAQREREPIDWRKVVLAIVCGIPYVLGRLVGRIVYFARIMAAALVEGYRAGDAPAAPRRPLVATAAPSTVDG